MQEFDGTSTGSGADRPEVPQSTPPPYYGLQVLPPATAVVELAAMMALILAIDWIWPALDIQALQPSPYWLPVLLLSLQYGTASGTLAVLAAIGAYFAFVTMPEQGVGENEFTYRLRLLAQPILWIAAAVLLGQFRMVQISAKRELSRRVGELETQRETLAAYANGLRSRCDVLERAIASQPGHVGASLLGALAGLREPTAGRRAAIERCLSASFPRCSVSLFARHGEILERMVGVGVGVGLDAKWAAILPADHPLVRAVITDKARVSILTSGDEVVIGHEGLAAVPVIDLATQQVVGMLKLESADAAVVTIDLLAQLDVVADALAPLLLETGGTTVLVDGAGDGVRGVATRPGVRMITGVDAIGIARADARDTIARAKAGR